METKINLEDKKLVIFELDDVLFPAKDYVLQVYYLFAQFIEYTEQKNAHDILNFMRQYYDQNGAEGVFDDTAKQFELADTYKSNFELLHKTARLPLKLLLFNNVLQFLQDLVTKDIKIYIVTAGDVEQQFNKIKQVEWNGLEQNLIVYFSDELNKSKSEIYQSILNTNKIANNEALLIAANILDEEQAKLINLPYIGAKEMYS
jgi:phosphoglycolate phosphatase-like HAD superfamily hydrolase